MTVQKVGVAAALPFLLNPATIGVVAIGAVGWGLYKLLTEDEEATEEAGPISQEPQKLAETLEEEACVSVGQEDAAAVAFYEASADDEEKTEAKEVANDAEQREIVRQAMSELGKRSAAARARRKAAASESSLIGGV